MEDLNREVMEKKEEKQSVVVKEVDRISNLPDPIVDIILSFLFTEDVRRMSFTSKRWQSIFLTTPYIDCDESWFYDTNKSFSQTRIQFLNFMNNTLLNRSNNNPINNLRISAIYPYTHDLDSLLNAYFSFLSTDNGKLLTLDISIPTKFSIPIEVRKYYILPNTIFPSGFHLTTLTLEGCIFEDPYDIVKSNLFPSLKKVSFKCVSISDRMLEMIIFFCPIETLILSLCRGFKLLRACNPSLMRLIVSNCSQIERVHIFAPKLQLFDFNMAAIPSLSNAFKIYHNTEIIDFWCPYTMRFLRVIALSHIIIRERVLKSMFSTFSNVKEVSFDHCEFKRVPLNLSKNVEKLEIKNCYYNGSIANALDNIDYMEMLSDFSYIVFEHNILGKAFSHLKSVLLCGEIFFPGNRFIMKKYNKGLVFLEKLCLENCNNLREIEISNLALKILVVDSCLDLEDCKIQAPNLEFFKYVGFVMDFKADELEFGPQVVVGLHLLKPCGIDFNSYLYDLDMWSSLQNFDRVKDLSFTNYCVDEPMHKDTSIQLKFEVDHDSSNMETSIWKTIKEHLVEVKVIVYEGKEDEMSVLIEYLLLEATFLRTMLISSIHKIPNPAKFHSQIKTIMTEYPLASPDAKVTLN